MNASDQYVQQPLRSAKDAGAMILRNVRRVEAASRGAFYIDSVAHRLSLCLRATSRSDEAVERRTELYRAHNHRGARENISRALECGFYDVAGFDC